MPHQTLDLANTERVLQIGPWTIPARDLMRLSASLGVALFLSLSVVGILGITLIHDSTSLSRERAEVDQLAQSVQPPFARREVILQRTARLQQIDYALRDRQESILSSLKPLVDFGNALPSNARLTAVAGTASALRLSGEAQTYSVLPQAQHQLLKHQIVLTLSAAASNQDNNITWDGAIGNPAASPVPASGKTPTPTTTATP